MKLHASVFLGFSLLSSCSSGDFTGSPNLQAGGRDCDPTSGAKCSPEEQLENDSPLTTQDGGLINTKCKFIDISVQTDGFIIPGGPPIKIKPSDLQHGVQEGDTLFVDLPAYQGPAGAGGALQNKMFSPELNPDGSILKQAEIPTRIPPRWEVPARLAQLGVSHGANEWSLRAFQRNGAETPLAIKHEYRIQITQVESGDCQAKAYTVRQPYYSRGPQIYNPVLNSNNPYPPDIDKGGCFALSTKIKMADGSEKLAVNIEKGDRLFNPATKKSVTVSEVVYGPEDHLGLIQVAVGTNVVRVTTQHPFETSNGLKAASELTINDKILTANGQYRKLTSLKVLPLVKNQKVINFVVSNNSKRPIDHMLEADGVITGDLYLQRQLGRRVGPKLNDLPASVAARP